MSDLHQPPSASSGRTFEATPGLKRSVQAAFNGEIHAQSYKALFLLSFAVVRLHRNIVSVCWAQTALHGSASAMSDFFHLPPWPPQVLSMGSSLMRPRTEPFEHHAKSSSGYRSKVGVLDRYKVVGFISSGTYGRVYKAIGVNGQSGEFAIKKYDPGLRRKGRAIDARAGLNRIRKARLFSTPGSRNQHVEKWPCAPSSPIQI